MSEDLNKSFDDFMRLLMHHVDLKIHVSTQNMRRDINQKIGKFDKTVAQRLEKLEKEFAVLLEKVKP